METELLDLWRQILSVAGTSQPREFRSVQTQFVGRYKRASNEEQGAFHHLLAEDNRAWARANGF